VQIPEGVFLSDLSDFAVRLLGVLCLKSGSEGSFKASIAEIGTLMGNPSDSTVRRAIKALEASGYLVVRRTKRANGYLGVNEYHPVTPDIHPVTCDRHPVTCDRHPVTSERTSHDYRSDEPLVNKPLVPNDQNTNSYKIKEFESNGIQRKEILIPMRKYEDDGEDLAGFGLVEDRVSSQPKVSKNNPKTRGKRPQHEWTPMDVAAEFSFVVGRKFPLLPGTVNVKDLSGALAKYRKQYQTTPLIELELLRLFMADERNFFDVGDEAPFLYKRYLSSFRTRMNQARENLGLSKIASVEFDETKSRVTVSVLTASDGKTFPNTLPGRAQMERYETRLKEKANG
jgi:hypothetical protein